MAVLKNIIFDLGGVLLSIDYNKTENAFKALGYTDFQNMYSQLTADELFVKLETGQISNEDFFKILTSAHAGEVTEKQAGDAWNSMLLAWRQESLSFLEQLSAHYKIFLLSNTNAIHEQAFNKSLKLQTGLVSIDPFFTKAYYSHKINLRKPGAPVFQYVLKDAAIKANETLFIDDSFNNIKTAASLGFKTHLLAAGEKIEELNYDSFH